MIDESSYQDRGYAWVMCLVCTLGLAITEGVGTAYGVMVPTVIKEYATGTADSSLIGSLHIGIAMLGGPIFMYMTQAFGCRTTALSGLLVFGTGLLICTQSSTITTFALGYGVVSSVGMGMKIAAEYSAIKVYFDKRMTSASSIFKAGGPLGYLVAAPVLSLVLQQYGLQAALYVQLGTVAFNGFLYLFLFRLPKNQKQYQKNESSHEPETTLMQRLSAGVKAMFLKSVVTNLAFAFKQASFFLFCFGCLVPALFIPLMLLKNGVQPTQAALALTILGVSNLVGRLSTICLDTYPSHALKICAASQVGCALAVGLMACKQTSLLTVYTACGLHGFFGGPLISSMPTCIDITVGKEEDKFKSAMGLIFSIYGLGVTLGITCAFNSSIRVLINMFSPAGPPAIGCLVDYWDGFEVPFYITSSLFVFAAILDVLSELTIKTTETRNDSQNGSDKHCYGSTLKDDGN